MKLLRITARHFKNCCDGLTIDFIAQSKKTAEDKEYELQEIAPDLYVFNTIAFVGKNASGKTSAIELLDCVYSILGEFRLEDKHYSYDGVELEITFFHEGYIYLYTTTLYSGTTFSNQAYFKDEHVYKKKYYKSHINDIFDRDSFVEEKTEDVLPEDTSKIFFVLKAKQTRAILFDSYSGGPETYRLLFMAMRNYAIDTDVFTKVLHIFDENIKALERLDPHNYRIVTGNDSRIMTDSQLVYYLSSGTTKGLLLYIMMVASLKQGFDLLIDDIENHFHKTLVENMVTLYKDKTVNRKNASLIFSTHYVETLDLMGRQDNIWICSADDSIHVSNMYRDFDIRAELLKSKQYYNNAFRTAVNYDALMALKKVLKK